MTKRKIGKTLLYGLLGIYAVISLYPLVWMAFYSLKSNEEIFVTNPFGPPLKPLPGNYYRAATEFNILVYFKNSILISAAALFIGIMCALMFTYVVARVKTRTTDSLRSIVILGMFIPIQAVMTPLVVMVKSLHLTNTHWALIIPYAALSFPFAVMVLYGFYASLPIELEESAYIEGASFYQAYFKVILPQMKSVIMVLLIYQFMSNWNEFSLALVLITKDALKTLPLGLVAFTGQFSTDWGPVGASLVMASLPVILLYIFFSDEVGDAMVLSGMKN
ncbi:MAG: carbohydrate ABC transporter permease [Lachnospiraceae bacterium]|nr:carbohydrate ABC transporter permease [Lachnospiraceae bacterium]